MSRPNPNPRAKLGVLGRVKPSLLVLLGMAPFIAWVYVQDVGYRNAFLFLLPGLQFTISVTLLGYVLASIIGLVLAGLMLLKAGRRTALWHALFALGLLASGAAFHLAPGHQLVLAGGVEGRVAIVRGTPQRLVTQVQRGTYAPEAQERRFLSALDFASALAFLEEGRVDAVLLPPAQVPSDLPVLWEVSYLPDSARNPANALVAFGTLAALLAFAGWQTREHPLAVFSELYVDLIRGIPMLVVILFIGFVLPGAIRDLTGGRIQIRSDLLRGVLAIAIGYAAYMAEVFRAGIEAVPKGQIEAARTLGLSGGQTARHVMLPQAIRIVLPPLGNEFIAMLKDTALLSVIGVGDVTQKAREYGAATLNLFPPYNSAAVLYVMLTLTASSLLRFVERRGERSSA